MSRTNNTPVPFWLSLPISQFGDWVRDSNTVTLDAEKQQQQRR